MSSSQSTVTLQQIVDISQAFADLEPVLNVGGQSSQPALTAANDTMNAICATAFPWKWNEIILPVFYTNSYSQDYAVVNPDGSSVTNLAWLERCIALDVNNTSIPKPFTSVECGREQQQATGTYWNSATNSPYFVINFFPNRSLYYGTWGVGTLGTSSFGNNPVPGSVYSNPVGSAVLTASWMATAGGQVTFGLNYIPSILVVGGTISIANAFPNGYNGSFAITNISGTNVTATLTTNPGVYQAGGIVTNPFNGQVGTNPPNINQPANPITQIRDSNGNLLLLTTYGIEGTTAPTAPKNAAPGTTVSGSGATTVWTVLDPNGIGFRVAPVPSQTGVVWEFNPVGQMKPVRFKSLSQTLDPLPDDMEPHFRQGFIAQLYRYSPEQKIRAKFAPEWQLWLKSLNDMRAKEDRELEENRFVPNRGIMGGGVNRNRFQGPQWPFGYPRI